MKGVKERAHINAERASTETARRDKENRVMQWLRARVMPSTVWKERNCPYLLWAVRDPESFSVATREAIDRKLAQERREEEA